jgi:penicillin-binding protein 1A
VAIAALLGTCVVLTAVAIGAQAPELDLGTDHLPPLEQAAARRPSMPTTVRARQGQVLGQFFPEERFAPVGANAIPPLVAAVVTASEDPSFLTHDGFTATALVRAALANATAGRTVEGGSTITQQLAKNLYTDGSRTVARKLRELAIAVTLEQRYSKQQLLAAYLNSTYFGNGAVGARAASETYFNKPLEQLDLSQVALLAGLIPAPSDRDPRVHPAQAEAARLDVLHRVAEARAVEPTAIDAARARPPLLAPPASSASSAPFFLEYVRQWLVDVAHIPAEQVTGGGLTIETNLDPALQQAALAAIAQHLPDPAGPDAALVVLDHHTGHVLALVGGRDWSRSKVDLARGAEGGGVGRQPGSAFKPFVLATALQAGFRPDDRLPAPASYAVDGADHPIENYSGAGYGSVSLTDATVRSINTAYAWLTEQVGPQQVRDVATALGIGHLPAGGLGPSIGLGAYETSPMDMAAAYATFAEDGHRVSPTPVTRVLGADGTVLLDNRIPTPGPAVLDPVICRTVSDVLAQVIERGTGTAAQLDRPAAGKTGTTDEYANAWFAGYTSQLAAAVWVGVPTANVPMHGINGVADVAGGTIPAAIWHDVMTAASAGLPAEPLPPLLPLPPGTQAAAAPAGSASPPSSATQPSAPQPSAPPPSATQPKAPPPKPPPPDDREGRGKRPKLGRR